METFDEYRRHVRGLRRSRETSRRAFYGAYARWARRGKPIWVGSRAVIEGDDRIEISDGGALRVAIGAFGMTCTDDTTVVRVRPGASFVCNGLVSVQRGARIVVDGGTLSIGHGTNVNGLAKILVGTGVTIGAYCTISWDAQILDNDFHTITVDGVDQPMSAPIVLGDRVWIGTGAIVLKGVTIGEGAVVGAGAVVTKDVPPHSVVAGVPAKVVGRADSWR